MQPKYEHLEDIAIRLYAKVTEGHLSKYYNLGFGNIVVCLCLLE